MTDAPTALPISPLAALSLPGEAPTLPVSSGAAPQGAPQTSDFSAILAALPTVASVPQPAAEPAQGALAALRVAAPAPTAPAPALPEGGRILPPPLPHKTPALRVEQPDGIETPVADTAANTDRLDEAAPDDSHGRRGAAPLVPAPQINSMPIASVPVPVQATPEQASSGPLAPAPPRPVPHPPQPTGSPRPVLTLSAGPVPAARGRGVLPRETAAQPGASPEPAQPGASRPAALITLPDTPAKPTAPLIAIALHAASERTDGRDEAPASLALPVLTAAAQPAPVAATTATPSHPASHDFAALVDRLAAAREAVQPQAVSVALNHSEFGLVRIDFRHEDGALSAALSSADPDFARAVAAVPVVPPAAAQSDAGQAQPRGTEPRQHDTGGHSPRGQSHGERRDDRAPQANRSPHRQAPREGNSDSDIFA